MKKKIFAVVLCLVLAFPLALLAYAENASAAPACDCGATGDVINHSNSCAMQTYYRDLAVNAEVADLAQMWMELPTDAQDYILAYLSWTNQTKLAELEAAIAELHPVIEVEFEELTFGAPVELTVTAVPEEVQDYLWDAPMLLEEGWEGRFFNINADCDGTDISLSGLLDSGDYEVRVYHFLDTPSEIREDTLYFPVSDEDAALFTDEIAAAKEAIDGLAENRVYYTWADADVTENGDITFSTDSFSMFTVIWKEGKPYYGNGTLLIHYVTQEANGTLTEFMPVCPINDVLAEYSNAENWTALENGLTTFNITQFAAQYLYAYGTFEYAYAYNNAWQAIPVQRIAYYSYGNSWVGYNDQTSVFNGGPYHFSRNGVTTLDVYFVFSNSHKNTVTEAESGINFRLFDYGDGGSTLNDVLPVDYYNINKNAEQTAVSMLAMFFAFSDNYSGNDVYGQGEALDGNGNVFNPGFESFYHGTVQRNMGADGYPVFSLTRTEYPNQPRPVQNDHQWLLSSNELSLGVLFGGKRHPAVQEYEVNNTLLTYDEKTGIYSYNSAKNAVDYDSNTKQFYVRNYVEKTYNSAWIQHEGCDLGDMLPFDTTGGYDNVNQWVQSIFDIPGYWPAGQGAPAHQPFYHYDYTPNNFNYWYGMSMELEFVQAKNGINSISKTNQVFEFSGDDDVWVYIDDIMVLDIGGTHSRISGYIDFATGEVTTYGDTSAYYGGVNSVYYERSIYDCFKEAYQEAGMSADEVQAELNRTFLYVGRGTHKISGKPYDMYRFRDYTSHKMNFYYLERGSYASSCYISFNLETIPSNTLSISKQVEGTTAVSDESFDFSVTLTDASNKPFVGAYCQINDRKIYDNTDGVADGIYHFSMKAGETARFPNLQAGTYYVVAETPDERYETKIDNARGTMSDQSVTVAITNILKRANLTLWKSVDNSTLSVDPNQTFIFTLKGIDGTATEGYEAELIVRGNSYVTINGLLIGQYIVTEDSGWSWRYNVTEVTARDGTTGVASEVTQMTGGWQISLTGNNLTVVVENSRDEPYWMCGSSYGQNLFVGNEKE